MTYKGHTEKGQVVLEDAPDLPEGTAVVVQVVTDKNSESLHPDIKRFTGIIPSHVDAQSEYREAIKNPDR